MYHIPDSTHRTEELIQRSRFIVSLGHAPTEKAARAFIDGIRREFPNATHNCWAYVAGPAGDTVHVGASDDGEPHGTAGKPMLTTLLHSGIGEVAAVVTRYFGGTKLGTGGLVRAYSGSLKNALTTLPIREHIDTTVIMVTADYAHISSVKQLLQSSAGSILQEAYDTRVRYEIAIPCIDADEFCRSLTNSTAGTAEIIRKKEDVSPFNVI